MRRLFRRIFRPVRTAREQLLKDLRQEMLEILARGGNLDGLMTVALKALRLILLIDRDLRRNIRDFNARYSFICLDGNLAVSVSFKRSRFLRQPVMEVHDEAIDNTNITVTFADTRTMAEFVMSESPDIFAGILDNKLALDGNLNYILKFIYLVRHVPKRMGIEPISCPA
ncbi:MAG: hypothetical protein GY835_11080 [bacterium]|nr:hypothetical protein [bacterium]